jgi:ADP-heptose:LPS heptosyltransferase
MRALLYCAGGGIGDSLVASVVARALHAKYTIVDALTLPGHRSTLERVPDVDAVLVDDGGDERALAGMLREREYDACVVTWATARTARVAQLAGIRTRVGQAQRLYSVRFSKRVVVRSERGNVTSPWADILLDYARAVGCDTDDIHPRFVPTAEDVDEASREIVRRGAHDGAFIVLHPTNAIATKRNIWPVEGWARLARALRERFRVPILLSGSNADIEINEAILRQAQDDTVRAQDDTVRAQDDTVRAQDDTVRAQDDTVRAQDDTVRAQDDTVRAQDAVRAQDDTVRAQDDTVINIAGKLGIGAFGALAQRAKAFVGITTGTMHVAAAVGAPTIGIFPFQSDFPDRWGPLGARTATVRPTFPCHQGDTKEGCRDYACIANLNVARIVAAVEELIG